MNKIQIGFIVFGFIAIVVMLIGMNNSTKKTEEINSPTKKILMEHTNKIIKNILSDEYSDYGHRPFDYNQEYKLLEEAFKKGQESPTHKGVTNFLNEQADKYKIDKDRIVVGIMQDNLYVWDYDVGRAMSEQWRTKEVIEF
jgi:hypothetical protein